MAKKKGFTLIELLIVITIIGILAVALIPRISQAPARARDVQRKADLGNIASALELYYSDNGEYPTDGATNTYPDISCPGEGAATSVETKIAPYMQGATVPADPSDTSGGGNCSTSYYYRAIDANSYYLVADLETETATGDGIYCDVDFPIGDATARGDCPGTDSNPKYIVGR